MSDLRLEFKDLSGGYASAQVVRGLSGNVAPGSVLCVIGRNGVGKSTLIKLLAGHLPCWHGTVALDGQSIGTLSPEARHRMGLSYMPQERPVFDELSVFDNLTLMRNSRSVDDFGKYFKHFPILESRLNQHAGTLSGGEKKILSFVRALSEDRPLVLLDEPSEGVQWENILRMEELIAEKKQTGTAFVVVEQNLEFTERVADRYLVMDQGRAVAQGVSSEFTRTELLTYLHV